VAPTELYAQRVGTEFIRTPSQPDICAFGGEIRIFFRAVTDAKQRPGFPADPPSANCRGDKILEECSLLLPSRHEKK
jgi:hypothetical protein